MDLGRRPRTRPGVKERFAFGATVDATPSVPRSARRDGFPRRAGDLLGDDGFLVLPTVPGAAPLKAARPRKCRPFASARCGCFAVRSVGLSADHACRWEGRRRAFRHLAARSAGQRHRTDRARRPNSRNRREGLSEWIRLPACAPSSMSSRPRAFPPPRARSAAPRRCCRNMCASWRTSSARCCSTARRASSR